MSFQPDWVLVYGDTNSTIAGALSAVKLHLPLAHLEAGLRSYNRSMPEEHNRVLTDHAADVCLAPSATAAQNLAKEGLSERTVLVGDVMVDVCYLTRDAVQNSDAPVPGVEPDERFLIATIHRAENTDDAMRLETVLKALRDLPLPVVLPAHPRLVAKAAEFGIPLNGGALRLVEPLSYPEVVKAVVAAVGVITDSGGLQKEAFLLGTPCTTLRTETEWVETLADGWNVLDPDLTRLSQTATRPTGVEQRNSPYGQGNAAHAVANALIEHH